MSKEEVFTSEEEFREWWGYEGTKKMVTAMKKEREIYVNRLISGGTLCGHGPTEQETARAVGIIYGIDLFLDTNWEE